MKILFLHDSFPPQNFGGSVISTYDIAQGMKSAGHEVFVVTTCRKGEEAGEFYYNGLKVLTIASDYKARWRAYVSLYNAPVIRKLEEILKNINPDVVHINNVHHYLSYHSIKLAKVYSKTTVVTLRDAMSFSFGKLETEKYLKNLDAHLTWLDSLKQARKRWNPLRNLFIKKYLGYADKVFAVSQALKKALEQNGIKGVGVIHSGALVDSWHVDEEEVAQFRQQYNLENKKVILFGGRLSEAKGGFKALEALALVVKESPDAVLLVMAKMDKNAETMKERANELGIGEHLVFTGWIEREKTKLIYCLAEIVLVPSICFDAFPRIVLEASASGKPIVGTCYGGASEVIVDGVTGYVVNPFNVKIMADKILDLLKSPEKAKAFGQAGSERVRTKFNLEDMVRKYATAYGI